MMKQTLQIISVSFRQPVDYFPEISGRVFIKSLFWVSIDIFKSGLEFSFVSVRMVPTVHKSGIELVCIVQLIEFSNNTDDP
jgi:hypothetical protein